MKLVRLDEARAGQLVGRDVTDARGSLLFKAGTILTADLIQKLRGWKVTHLFVDDTPSAILPPLQRPAAKQAALDRELDSVFTGAVQHPVMARLREAAGRYLKARIK